ncbi:substrate-binding domain-containing protein [Pseudoalteromonas mariniglutinosa]|uniref:substrate-binding domain-containing protein n=1 Tax=Pseudoalteromonas mariniglutinosa TaxID=206042 RepID=UPI00384AE186
MMGHHCYAKTVIGIVGKTKNDTFYEQAYRGCLKFAASHNDIHCVYDGPDDYQDIRTQALIINELVEKGIDGLLIATTDSDFLVERVLTKLEQQAIPVITFDSDLLEKHQHYRLAYVGTNNFDFGVALGNQLKQFTNGAQHSVCIQSGHPTTPNLNKRIAGVRFALSGQSSERLSGQNGWTEFSRCPLYSLGKRDTSLAQLENLLKMKQPPMFLAVAGFAQFSPHYIATLQTFNNKLKSTNAVIVSADTEEIQLRALQLGLSSANIGQNPFEMGRLSTELMYNYLVKGEPPSQSHYYLDFHYCQQENTDTCTINH